LKIGRDWNFIHVFSGGDGVIFAINDKHELFYYKFLGMATGENQWGRTGAQIGVGWDFVHVFSGGDGVIFAINDKNELFYYKFLGMATGENRWGRTGAQIGTGWKFLHVSSGGNGVIYAVNEQDELFYFKYLGMETGDWSWGPVNIKIGTDWDYERVFSEIPAVALVANPPPRAEQLPPNRDPRCSDYASEAIQQFKATLSSAKCRVNTDGVWNSDFEHHYQWCRTASRAAAGVQESNRNEHLYACGARQRPATY
jgi:Tachylectin